MLRSLHWELRHCVWPLGLRFGVLGRAELPRGSHPKLQPVPHLDAAFLAQSLKKERS